MLAIKKILFAALAFGTIGLGATAARADGYTVSRYGPSYATPQYAPNYVAAQNYYPSAPVYAPTYAPTYAPSYGRNDDCRPPVYIPPVCRPPVVIYRPYQEPVRYYRPYDRDHDHDRDNRRDGFRLNFHW